MLILDIPDIYIERIQTVTCSLRMIMPLCPVFTWVVLSIDVILSEEEEVDENILMLYDDYSEHAWKDNCKKWNITCMAFLIFFMSISVCLSV